MRDSAVAARDLRFDLRGPCADCPFRSDAKMHNGVFKDLPKMVRMHEDGRLAHTCHKTDPRADGYVEGYSGPVQHCGGMLAMIAADPASMGAFHRRAVVLGRWKPEKMDLSNVFRSWRDMVNKYIELASASLKDNGQ